MDDRKALELIRLYFDEAATFNPALRLHFAGRAGSGYIVVLANPLPAEPRGDGLDDPATVIEVSEEAVAAAERVIVTLRRDHPALRAARISLVFDDPQEPDVYPGDFGPG